MKNKEEAKREVSDLLIIVVEDNGDYIKRRKTLKSLERQNSNVYGLSFFCKENREKTICNFSQKPDDYFFFVKAGYELMPDAVETINRWIQKKHELWYYGDEYIWENAINKYENKAKPHFGILGFISSLYTGAAIIFSGRILKNICHNVFSADYNTFIIKMTIDAASFYNGYHIEKTLLQRMDSFCLSEKNQEEVNQWINALLRVRGLPIMAVIDQKEKLCRLYRRNGVTKTSSIIVVLKDSTKLKYWRNMYEDSYGCRQVIVSDSGKTIGEKWNRAAEKAEGELLFFVYEGCQIPAEYKMKELEAFVAIPDTGIVSPKLIGYDGEILYTGAARTGEGFCSPLMYNDPEWNGYVKGIREISVPSCYFFVVQKALWKKIGGFSEINISREFCLADFALRLEKEGYVSLYHGQIAVFMNERITEERQKGLLYVLQRWGRQWERDLYFTKAMCRKILEPLKKYTQIIMPDQQMKVLNKKKRILILSHELSMTGAPLAVFYASCILKEEGFLVLVLSPEDGVLKNNYLKKGIPVLIDERIYQEDSWLSYAKEFDLVLVNTVVPFMCVEYLEKAVVPAVWWIHDAKEGYEAKMRNVLPDRLGKMTDLYCVSGYARDVLLRFRPQYCADLLLYGLPELLNIGINKNISNKIERMDKHTVFVIVGTLETRKGQDILLDAIEKMDKENREKCKFYFIGSAKQTKVLIKLEEVMRKYPSEIKWIPFLDRKEMMETYDHATAVICCSRDDPMPVTMAEAMMMSKICICSENTGTASLIENGKNGFVYKENSSEELLNVILYVIKNREYMSHICKAARKTYEEKFALPIFKKNLLHVLEKNLDMVQGADDE